jgi:hypothetical protein
MLSEKEYLEGRGLYCPYCEWDEISQIRFQFKAETYFEREMICLSCKGRWKEFYTLTGMKEAT